jgi:hypothetical protein
MSNDRKSQTSDSDKKLRLSRETVRNLNVRTDVKTGWGFVGTTTAPARATEGCPSGWPTVYCGAA